MISSKHLETVLRDFPTMASALESFNIAKLVVPPVMFGGIETRLLAHVAQTGESPSPSSHIAEVRAVANQLCCSSREESNKITGLLHAAFSSTLPNTELWEVVTHNGKRSDRGTREYFLDTAVNVLLGSDGFTVADLDKLSKLPVVEIPQVAYLMLDRYNLLVSGDKTPIGDKQLLHSALANIRAAIEANVDSHDITDINKFVSYERHLGLLTSSDSKVLVQVYEKTKPIMTHLTSTEVHSFVMMFSRNNIPATLITALQSLSLRSMEISEELTTSQLHSMLTKVYSNRVLIYGHIAGDSPNSPAVNKFYETMLTASLRRIKDFSFPDLVDLVCYFSGTQVAYSELLVRALPVISKSQKSMDMKLQCEVMSAYARALDQRMIDEFTVKSLLQSMATQPALVTYAFRNRNTSILVNRLWAYSQLNLLAPRVVKDFERSVSKVKKEGGSLKLNKEDKSRLISSYKKAKRAVPAYLKK